jgi:hypothetical protein
LATCKNLVCKFGNFLGTKLEIYQNLPNFLGDFIATKSDKKIGFKKRKEKAFDHVARPFLLQNGATKGNADEHKGKGDKELTSLLLAKLHLEANLKMNCFPRVSITRSQDQT